MTIVEMLVSMAITLVMMAAVVNVFARVSDSVNKRRSIIEMSSMARTARQMLQNDLTSATCPTLPWTRVNAGAGYFEIVEGPLNDALPSLLTDGNPNNGELDGATSPVPRAAAASDPNTPNPNAFPNGLGDYDDILALTIRSEGEPFVGRFGGGTLESNLAEVIWFAVENPNVPIVDPNTGQPNPLYLGEPGLRTVYRRILLIAPWKGAMVGPAHPSTFFREHDISARFDANRNRWIANTLADLTMRENRFGHLYDPSTVEVGFPHAIDLRNIRRAPLASPMSPLHPFGYPFETFVDFNNDPDPRPLPSNPRNRKGEDIVLTDVLAFDLRVFDPRAPILNAGTPAAPVAVQPGDPFWIPAWAAGATHLGYGAYVDLGYRATAEQWIPTRLGYQRPASQVSVFSLAMHPKSQLGGSPLLVNAVYDTWSYHYETDGLDQDDRDGDKNALTGADEGTDGIDNDPQQYGVDDIEERETSPPYDVPLRGVQVTFRTFERDSRVPRQVSVRQSFVPQ